MAHAISGVARVVYGTAIIHMIPASWRNLPSAVQYDINKKGEERSLNANVVATGGLI